MVNPNLLVIGAMKSGTTSLYYYFGMYPELQILNDMKQFKKISNISYS